VYITADEHAAVEAALDRVRAMLWRLTRRPHVPGWGTLPAAGGRVKGGQ
jgi:hypothetical protein